MQHAAIVVDPEKIIYGSRLKRFHLSRTEDISLQLRVVADELIRLGATDVKVLAPGHEAEVERLRALFPRCTFRHFRLIDIIGPLARSRVPLQKMGQFQTKHSFGIVWCSLRNDAIQLLAYQATADGPTGTWTYTHKNDLLEGYRKAGYMLEMAESLYADGATDIALFIPGPSDVWLVLAQQIADRLKVNLAVFITPDIFDGLASL